MNLIEVKELYKSFGDLKVLENVNLEVAKGERIAIIGGSGCGKSVFLRSLELLHKPDKGQIFIDGEEITALNGVDLNIPAGSFVSFIGPSGCGKTTLLRIIAGLEKPSSCSELTLDGEPIKKAGYDIHEEAKKLQDFYCSQVH